MEKNFLFPISVEEIRKIIKNAKPDVKKNHYNLHGDFLKHLEAKTKEHEDLDFE
jgi:hypothetical protein